jgi:hypothetical protein
MKLTDRFDDDVIEYKGRQIRLGLYFDVVLRAFELLHDEHFTTVEKIDILLHMFVENHEALADLSIFEKNMLVGIIFDRFINDKTSKPRNTEKPLFDFEKDAEYIYASFLYDYGIDLFEQQGKMHWKKFKALLVGLSEDSKFMKVIGYRTMEIPNKIPAKERQRLIELKRFYSLEQSQTVEDIDARFETLAAMMRPTTKKTGGGPSGNQN